MLVWVFGLEIRLGVVGAALSLAFLLFFLRLGEPWSGAQAEGGGASHRGGETARLARLARKRTGSETKSSSKAGWGPQKSESNQELNTRSSQPGLCSFGVNCFSTLVPGVYPMARVFTTNTPGKRRT